MKKLILTICISVFLKGNILAQEKIYYSKKNEIVSDKTAADFYVVLKTASETNTIEESKYSMDDKLVSITNYSDYEGKIRNGKSEYYYGGNLSYSQNYKDNKRHGELKWFYTNGRLQREENYTEGKLTDGKCYDENGNEIPFFEYETQPEYPGGVKLLYKYIAENFKPKGFEHGKIIVEFVVEKDGTITDVKIKKGLSTKMDKEAIRVIKSLPKWKPGTQNNKPVRVMYSLPINVAKE